MGKHRGRRPFPFSSCPPLQGAASTSLGTRPRSPAFGGSAVLILFLLFPQICPEASGQRGAEPGRWEPECGHAASAGSSPLLQLQTQLPKTTEVPDTRGGGSRHRYVLRPMMVFSPRQPPSTCRRHNLFLFHVPCEKWGRKRRNSPQTHFTHGFSLFEFAEPPDFHGACADPSIRLTFALTDGKPAFLSYLPQPLMGPSGVCRQHIETTDLVNSAHSQPRPACASQHGFFLEAFSVELVTLSGLQT